MICSEMIWLSFDEGVKQDVRMDDAESKGALMTIDYCSKITPLLPTGAKQYLPADMSPVICGELSLEKAGSSAFRASVHY